MTSPALNPWSPEEEGLSARESAVLDRYAFRIARRVVAWVAVANVVALAGLYAYMSSRIEALAQTAARAAAEDALVFTDRRSESIDRALADALVRSGELKRRADEIAQQIESIGEVPAGRVAAVATLIRSNDRQLRELAQRQQLTRDVARLKTRVGGLETAPVTGATIVESAIEGRHLKDGTITEAKLEPGLLPSLLPSVVSSESQSIREWSSAGGEEQKLLTTAPLSVAQVRPVLVQLVDASAASPSWLGGSPDVVVDVRITRGDTSIWYGRFADGSVAPSAVSVLDFPPKGEHTYSLSVQKARGAEVSLHHVRLVATRM